MIAKRPISSWEHLIDEYRSQGKLRSRTCCIFNRQPTNYVINTVSTCPCGRLVKQHSFDGTSVEAKEVSKGIEQYKPPEAFLDGQTHSSAVSLNVYGELSMNGCKFLRVDSRCKAVDLFELILRDCNGEKPALMISVFGGAKYFTMTERLEKEFIRGVIDAATTADAWILTAGINNGVSKLIGEGISHYRLLREHRNQLKCIGMTMWGTVTEKTRMDLKTLSKEYSADLRSRQIPDDVEENEETIEPHHTHCILFDSGRLSEYLSDSHRHQFVKVACNQPDHICYSVTLIVEGGLGSLEVLRNDIEEGRPAVLIQGSGRLADLLATLIDQTSTTDGLQHRNPSDREIENVLDRFFPNLTPQSIRESIGQLKKILDDKNRYLLHVFSLERDKNVAETIFKAIFTAEKKRNKEQKNKTEVLASANQEEEWRIDEDKFVDLALKWNYFDGILPILQARQEEVLHQQEKALIEKNMKRQKELFRHSLLQNRPTFVEYFLSAGFNPVTLLEGKTYLCYRKFLVDLYRESYKELVKNNKKYVARLFGRVPAELRDLDQRLNKFVGAYLEPIYVDGDAKLSGRIAMDLNNHVCICCGALDGLDRVFQPGRISPLSSHFVPQIVKEYPFTSYSLLRDLFVWSVFMDMPEMAKVLLLHLRSRICAALIASAIFKRYARESPTVDLKDRYRLQSLEFETYAAMCIDKCYEYNELRACELLLRQIPLFGNVTCMQVAIASESRKLLETACFDQTLNQVWYNKLALINHRTSAKLSLLPPVLTVGLLAPIFVTYRDHDGEALHKTNNEAFSNAGINYYINYKDEDANSCNGYWKKVLYFHESPMIKMCYHFITYIWFLLVFSYMMLYHLDGRDSFVIPHWTEIYVIITVSTMFCEEVRKLYHEYHTHMIERWGSTGSTVVNVLSNIFYVLPYFLFYLGLGFRYGSFSEGLLSTARIIWALDLELWYLRSLKFVIALKFLGPKLFMLKNMLRDLFAFVYMIFIAVSAYGVVSRALILYKQVPFTARGLFSEIFYAPYWFIYGEVSDKTLLDERLSNETNFTEAEATATHVLLAFHMLFINILLLNLLVAVFADSIGKVQENTEFYWRYQRYSFVREYFERVPFGYPPLIFISHLVLLLIAMHHRLFKRCCRNRVSNIYHVSIRKRATPIFKMIPIYPQEQDEAWDSFENAATYTYARSVLEQHQKSNGFDPGHEVSREIVTTINATTNPTTNVQASDLANFKAELMNSFRLFLNEAQRGLEQNTTKLEHRLEQINTSVEWMMDAIERVKMNHPKHPKPYGSHSPISDHIPTTNKTD